MYAATDTATGYIPTMEFESDVPYSAEFNPDTVPTSPTVKIEAVLPAL